LRAQRAPWPSGSPLSHKVRAGDFRVVPGKQVKLGEWPTSVRPVYRSKKHYESLLEKHIEKLKRLQDLLYACNRYALLLIFQAMDTAGKDGAIKHVMSGVNPQGCQVFSFKGPSPEELEHDFLWRTTRSLPERGRIGIFNRSYYEEVLVVRVHPDILQGEHLPDEAADDPDLWRGRYRSIVDLEDHLHRNGTRVLKFFLHLSRAEQRKRLLARVDDPRRNWKFSMADLHERRSWDEYIEAYEHMLGATSTRDSPWHIVPADDKKNARLIISSILHEALHGLQMEYPQANAKQRQVLERARRLLIADRRR
jgi:PPK2 family polyphosphate:nucleotide phosphotransferase